jgi:hypothetical protein
VSEIRKVEGGGVRVGGGREWGGAGGRTKITCKAEIKSSFTQKGNIVISGVGVITAFPSKSTKTTSSMGMDCT